MQLPEFSGARLIMADVNRRGSTVRDERAWVEPSPRPRAGGPGQRVTHRYRLAPPDVTSATMGPVSEQTSPRPRVSARLAAIAESATLAVDAKAKALKAAGRPVIGFGAGEPDFPTPGYIVDAAVAAAKDPVNHRYTPAAGLPALREAIAAKTLRDSGYEVKPSSVLVTNGGKQAVYQSFAAIVDPGDEVLLPAPYWTTYPEAIRLAGGVPGRGVRRRRPGLPGDRRAARGRAHAADQGRCCSAPRPTRPARCTPPSRPPRSGAGRSSTASGSSPTRSTSTSPTTTRCSRPSCARCRSSRTRRSSLNGVAKTYAMTGWRVGWMIGPADVITAATNLQSHLTSNVANVSQRAAIAALTGDLAAVEEMRTAFDRRRRTIVEMLSQIDGVRIPAPQGAFYVYPSVEGVLGRTIRGVTPRRRPSWPR